MKIGGEDVRSPLEVTLSLTLSRSHSQADIHSSTYLHYLDYLRTVRQINFTETVYCAIGSIHVA
jgi:hypothetical protein